jgi:hypothetical protein
LIISKPQRIKMHDVFYGVVKLPSSCLKAA